MDIDAFEERAAIMEFGGGMTRFQAETAAASAQGYRRWEVLNAISKRNSEQARDHGSASAGNAAHGMSRVQPVSNKKERSMSQRQLSS